MREKLNKRIEEKRAEIEDLESKARDARIYLQALEDTLRLLPKDTEEDGAEFNLRPGTNVDKAREALKAKGAPMHIAELLTVLGKPNDNLNRAALAGSLSAYVRKGQVFTRPAPNTFGLTDFAQAPTPISLPQHGPPPTFGMDEPIDQIITDDDVPF